MIHAIIASNIRIADQRIGDIQRRPRLMVGQDRLSAILDRYGDDTVVAAIASADRRRCRCAPISPIADGVYRSGGSLIRRRRDEPLTIALAVEKEATR
jgi:N-methylhydantoinase B